MNYKKLITERKSVRDYKKTKVSEKNINKILEYSINCGKLISTIENEIIIKDNDKDNVFDILNGTAGYLGRMIEAPHYLIILSDKNEYYVENTGYLGEKILLKAFDLGVNSCWITFPNSDIIKEKLNITTNKEVCALIALGYDANKTKIINPMQVGGNYSKSQIDVVNDNTSFRYKIQDIVYFKEWDNKANLSDLKRMGLLEALHYARMAPSTLNRQPWRFILDDGMLILTIRDDDNTSEYEEKIDSGISMLYFELIVDQTLFDLTWIMGKPKKEYSIPENYKIVSFCKI